MGVAVGAFWLFPGWAAWGIAVLLGLGGAFVCRFFRVPERCPEEGCADDPKVVVAPADGTVVAIEEVAEDEVFGGEKRLQISIFMSVWNIHMNWYPVAGEVEYFRHHPGRFLVAWHPKSSTDNERTTTVVRTADGQRVLFRQIAGFVARRIVSYAPEKMERAVACGEECGFIKFGSRVDVFLPLGSEVCVRLGDKTTGMRTRLGRLK
jgi:phosphatidylserine decarboxylase